MEWMDHGWDDDRQCDGARFMCFCRLVPALCLFEQSTVTASRPIATQAVSEVSRLGPSLRIIPVGFLLLFQFLDQTMLESIQIRINS
jgi:hypothetical protein